MTFFDRLIAAERIHRDDLALRWSEVHRLVRQGKARFEGDWLIPVVKSTPVRRRAALEVR